MSFTKSRDTERSSSASRQKTKEQSRDTGRNPEGRALNGSDRASRAAKDRAAKYGDKKDAGDLERKALDDLARSSLDRKDFKRLQLELLTRDECDSFVGEPRAAYKIPYFDVSGKRIAYSRVRFLENRKGGFSKREGSFRYSQPFNSTPHIYLPPYLNWKKIAKDPEQKILITEGEKKAALACKLGIPCIALGGVYGYKSKKRMWDLIPEMRDIVWSDREIEICYDADVMLKSEVRDALNGLAFTLTTEYAPKSIGFVLLDAETAGPKTGLDDYLKEHGAEAFEELDRQEYRAAARIQELNDRICYVENEMRFFDIRARKFFRSYYHARETFMNAGEEIISPKQTALVIDLWAKSAHRRTVKGVIYDPGAPEITDDNELNLWRATPTRPVKGKPDRWLELVHHIFRKPEYAEWFIKWLAYPVQNPGTKMFQAVFVHGAKQGIGKTFTVDPVMEFIYGKENFHRLKNANLGGAYNSFAGKTQFVVTNEIYLSDFKDRKELMSEINDMITRETVSVNEKFQPEVSYSDHCNFYFTSNHPDALVIDPNDRRLFVIEAPTVKLEQHVYTELDEWVRGEGGGVILHHLLNRVDVSDVNPKADVMRTEYKEGLVSLSRDQLGEFVERMVNDPQSVLIMDGVLPDLELYKAEDLLKLFERLYPKYRFNVTIQRMSRLFKDAKIEKRSVRLTSSAPLQTLYAVFKRKEWRERTNRDWAEHYTGHAKKYGGSTRT